MKEFYLYYVYSGNLATIFKEGFELLSYVIGVSMNYGDFMILFPEHKTTFPTLLRNTKHDDISKSK